MPLVIIKILNAKFDRYNIKPNAMKCLLFGLLCIMNLTSFNVPQFDDYEIATFYKALTPVDGTKVLTTNDDLEDVELILIPISINDGKYVVTVTRKSDNLYKVDDKNIYIETKYCHEYSYADEVVLKVENGYYSKGKIIF